MKFRTEIEPIKGLRGTITHETPVLLLGSCFTDNIGRRLEAEGFQVDINPAGTVFNPWSVKSVLERIYFKGDFTEDDLVCDPQGVYHSFELHSRFSSTSPATVVDAANRRLAEARAFYDRAEVAVITLGSSMVYLREGETVANCHKFPAADFDVRRLSPEEVRASLETITTLLAGKRIIFTVSPVRHVAYGLHGNQLSKASLLLGVDSVENVIYYPAYEILNDDLRDYRFYADDLKHPSEKAVEYVYDHFCETFMTAETREKARAFGRAARLAAHRRLIN